MKLMVSSMLLLFKSSLLTCFSCFILSSDPTYKKLKETLLVSAEQVVYYKATGDREPLLQTTTLESLWKKNRLSKNPNLMSIEEVRCERSSNPSKSPELIIIGDSDENTVSSADYKERSCCIIL